jgi:hypothetical protein
MSAALVVFHILGIFSLIATLWSIYVNYFPPEDSKCLMSYYHVAHQPLSLLSNSLNLTQAIQLQHNRIQLYNNNGMTSNDAAAAAVATAAAAAETPDELYSHYSNMELLHELSSYRLYRYYDPQHPQALVYHHRAIIFIPGSSGSFHQSRSLFARVNLIIREKYNNEELFDYFALDFNEEKSALAGLLIYRQAIALNHAMRTILYNYYQHNPNKSFDGFFTVEHSMGGIVSSLANNVANSIVAINSSLILARYGLGVPHAEPVIVPDKYFKSIYQYLRSEDDAYRVHNSSSSGPLPLLISVSGGIRDRPIESSRSVLVSSALTYSTLSSSIPHIQSSADHESLCWCRQLMETLAHSILDITNNRHNHNMTKQANTWLNNRMRHKLQSLHELFQHSSNQSACAAPSTQFFSVLPSQRFYPIPSIHSSLYLFFEFLPAQLSLCRNIEECMIIPSKQFLPLHSFYSTTQSFFKPNAGPFFLFLSNHTLAKYNLIQIQAPPAAVTEPYAHGAFIVINSQHKVNLGELTSIIGMKNLVLTIPTDAERYYQLIPTPLSHSSQDFPVFIHFTSLPNAANPDSLIEDQYILAVNQYQSCIVRFPRRSFERRISVLFIQNKPVLTENHAIEVKLIELTGPSILRTLYLMLPGMINILFGLALLLSAASYQYFRALSHFPSIIQLFGYPSSQRWILFVGSVVMSFCCLYQSNTPVIDFSVPSEHLFNNLSSSIKINSLSRFSSEIPYLALILLTAGTFILYFTQSIIQFTVHLIAKPLHFIGKILSGSTLNTLLSPPLLWIRLFLLALISITAAVLLELTLANFFSDAPVPIISPIFSLLNLHSFLPTISPLILLVTLYAVYLLLTVVMWESSCSSLIAYRVMLMLWSIIAIIPLLPNLIAFVQPAWKAGHLNLHHGQSTGNNLVFPFLLPDLLEPQYFCLCSHLIILMLSSLRLPRSIPSFQPIVLFLYGLALLVIRVNTYPLYALFSVIAFFDLCLLPAAFNNLIYTWLRTANEFYSLNTAGARSCPQIVE